MAKYLVTSSCNFLSSALTDHLLAKGNEVIHILLTNTDEAFTELNDCLTCETKLRLIAETMHKVDGCFHLTDPQSLDNDMNISRKQYLCHLEVCTFIFNQAAVNNIPLVFSSSASVYGNNVDFPLSEHSITQPTTLHGANMVAIEQYARTLALTHHLPVTALRLFEVYGGTASSNRITGNLLKQLTDKIFDKDKLVIKEALHSIYDFIHIDDVVRGFLSAMDNISSPFQVINLCSGQSVTADRIVSSVLNITSLNKNIQLLDNGLQQSCLSVGDNKLGKKLLKFEPNINLIEGLTSTFRPLMPLA